MATAPTPPPMMTGVQGNDDSSEVVELVVVVVVKVVDVVVDVVELDVELEIDAKLATMLLLALTTMVVARDVVATAALLKPVMPFEGTQDSKLYPAFGEADIAR
jgi:hypothetical protein